MWSIYWLWTKNIFGFIKKLLFVGIIFTIIISIFLHFINRDKLPTNQNAINDDRTKLYQTFNNPQLNKTPEGKTEMAYYRLFTCGMIGEGCSNNINDKSNNFFNSIFGFLTKLVIAPYANPAASGLYWARNGLENTGFIPKTYAAEGIGFASLKPFLNIWKIFRDISYMLLVLVLIATGFMIMFRMKLNPQTVISVENALPKIVISLILITFSYAIAGFLIDLMYVISAISISLLSNNNTYYSVADFQTKFLSSNIGTIWDGIFNVTIPGQAGIVPFFGGFNTLFYIGDALVGIIPRQFNDFIRLIVLFFSTVAITFPILHAISGTDLPKILNDINVLGNSLGKIPGGIFGTIIAIVVFLIVIPLFLVHGAGWIIGILIFFSAVYLFIRIVVILFRAYLQILLLVIFSPVFLLFEAIPGRSAFSYWFKNLVAELLTFPVIIVLFIVAHIITNTLSSSGNSISVPPLLGGIEPTAFYVILGLGIIFLIPDFVKIVKGLIGVKEGLPINIGPGIFFSGVGAVTGGTTGTLGQFSSIRFGLNAIGLGGGKGFLGLGTEKKDPLGHDQINQLTQTGTAPTVPGSPTGSPTGSPK